MWAVLGKMLPWIIGTFAAQGLLNEGADVFYNIPQERKMRLKLFNLQMQQSKEAREAQRLGMEQTIQYLQQMMDRDQAMQLKLAQMEQGAAKEIAQIGANAQAESARMGAMSNLGAAGMGALGQMAGASAASQGRTDPLSAIALLGGTLPRFNVNQ